MKQLNENYYKTIDAVNEFLNNIAKKPVFYIPLLFSAFISYGFSIMNRTIFIDDMAQDYYYGSGLVKIRMLRWGQYLMDKIFSTPMHTPFINKFIGAIFLVLTAISLSALFYQFDQKRNNVIRYTIMSCIFVSYPLISEFFSYFEALTIPVQFFIVTVVLLYEVNCESKGILDYLVCGLVLSVVMSGYETLVFVYITEVFIVLFLKYVINDNKDPKLISWLKEGMEYAYPLVVALLGKYLFGYLLLFVLRVEYIEFGNTSIGWFSNGFMNTIYNLLKNIDMYVIRGLSYMPISELVIGVIVFVVYIIKYQFKSKYSIFNGLLILSSLFYVSLLQGDYMNFRQAQSIHLFVAFVVYLVLYEINNKNTLYKLLIVALSFLCLRQSIYTHQLLALDNQRSDNEAYILQNIGYRIYSEFDKDKKVVVCGKYHMGDYIESQITIDNDSLEAKFFRLFNKDHEIDADKRLVDKNVSSSINWALRAFENQEMLKHSFSYYGFDLNIDDSYFDRNTNKEYEKIALENNMKPLEIKDMGDYILVYLGKID